MRWFRLMGLFIVQFNATTSANGIAMILSADGNAEVMPRCWKMPRRSLRASL